MMRNLKNKQVSSDICNQLLFQLKVWVEQAALKIQQLVIAEDFGRK